jgi:fermentation-respiration switch protein FrsA (DUF1100 family)
MLFCHGNAGNIYHRLDNIFRLNTIGLSVFIFDYRGYGKSGGRITERGFYLDSEAAYQVARNFADREELKLVVFGRSLGGIAAVHIASANRCSGVILESTFTLMPVPGWGSGNPVLSRERLVRGALQLRNIVQS